MKKIYAILSVAAISSAASAAVPSLEGRINLKDVVKVTAQSEKKVEVTSVSDQQVIPLRVQVPQKASTEKKTVVLYEDFNKVPDGDTETIGEIGDRYTDYVASRYFEPGRYIDNDYTPESGTWEGDFVMAGKGGTVVLQCYNPQMGALLNTPLGDYSGDITVTVRARAVTPFWGADNELGYVTTAGSELQLFIATGGYDSMASAKTDIEGYYSILHSGQIYPKEGWQEITYKFRNESANANGYLSFQTSGSVEIDWIKVTDDNTFLSCPVVSGASNFKKDGFTINWDPVRRSYNYYIDLWKTVYTADSGVDSKCDFEGSLPEWLTGDQVEVAEGEGVNGSNAVLFPADGENNGLTTGDFGMNLESFTTKVKFQMDDTSSPVAIMYDVYGENGWEPFGYLQCDGWWTAPGKYYNIVLDGEKFAGLYSQLRVYAYGTTENNKVYVDDMTAWAKRPYVLERVESDFGAIYDPENDDFQYNYYTYTGIGKRLNPNDPGLGATYYTFVGLDPDTEYWYRVRSHNVLDFTVGEKHHAFGVAAPELTEATNIATGTYTANWTDAAKAQKYYVHNYTAEKITEADPDYAILSEAFTRSNGDSDITLMQPVEPSENGYLDAYTDHKGWSGANVYYGYKMLGGSDYTGSYLVSPAIMANPARGSVYVYVSAFGYAGDYLYITCLKSGFGGPVKFDDEGSLSGWLEIPAVEGEQIKLQSYYGVRFAVSAFEAVQAVEAGDVVRRFDSSVEVPAGVGSYTFSNLEGDLYSYAVVSSFTLENETTQSTSDAFVTVDLKAGSSNIFADVEAVGVAGEQTRFSVAGTRVGSDYKGIVIVKDNDGKVSKQIVK